MSFSASTSEDFEMIDYQEANLGPEDLAKLQGWLQPTDYTADSSEFHRHLSSQAPGTGLWICDTSRFQQWHQSDFHGSLWVKGVPGAGKSVIAASIVEHLKTTEDVPVLFFFFRYIIAANRRPRHLVQDFLAQLLPRCPRLQATLQPLLGSELDHLSDDRLWEFLLLGLASIEKAYVVVDAMDEMELASNDGFLQRLNALATFRPKSVKLFMTSRPKQYLQSALRDASIVHISLEDDLVGKDIALFVAHRLKDVLSGDENRLLLASLESTICERSRGLFLYARLLVDQIIPKLKATGQLDVQKLAQNLPIGLEDMYNSMLYQNTQNQKIETAVQTFLLEFVTHSSRALRLNELANVLASVVPTEKLPGTPKNVARTACAPLLEILEDETVQVIHHSFTEFLLDNEREGIASDGSTPQFPVLDPAQAHRKIAMTSLKYLQSSVLRHPDAEEAEKARLCDCDSDFDCRCRRDAGGTYKEKKDPYNYQEWRLRYPFLEYAVTNWAFHCHRYDEGDEEFLQAVSSFLNPESPDFKQWLRLEWTKREVPGVAQTPAPLHVAAFAGMTKYAARLLREGQVVDPLDADEFTPLHWATRRGHTEMVALLLQHGADANAYNCRGVVPLHEAAKRNKADIVKLLLEAGVDPITPKTKENHAGRLLGGERSTKGETAVEYACKQGHLDTILVMLPYLKPESLQEVLGRACRHGEFEIAKAVLSNSDVSPNARFEGGTPLYVATLARSISCVELLLAKGANPLEQCDYAPNHRIHGGGRFGREGPIKAPLHILYSSAREEAHFITCHQILKLLLKAGADINAKDGNGNTPLMLQFADRTNAHMTAIKSFLEAGADVSVTNSNGDSVLPRALVERKDLDIIKLLLEHGANVLDRGSKADTTLHQILAHPHGNAGHNDVNEILALLLEKGARPDLKNDYGRTALDEAIMTRTVDLETFRILLEKCDEKTKKRCIWLLGSRKDVKETKQFIELLLANGASLEDRDSNGRTPILKDLRETNAVKALRQMGANIHAVDNHGRGMLHCFIQIFGGHYNLATFNKYVDFGLDPLVVDNDGDTLLHVAARNFQGKKGDVEFVEHLLSLGISMNARNKKGETPLHDVISHGRINSSSNEKRVSLAVLFQRHKQKEKLDLNAQDHDGMAPIHLATLRSEFELSRLLSAGADPSLVTKDKRNILHLACRARKTNTVALIAEKVRLMLPSFSGSFFVIAGSRVDCAHVSGPTGPGFFLKCRHREQCRTMQAIGAPGKDLQDQASTSEASRDANPNVAGIIRECKGLINAQDVNGRTPLHDACISGRPESVFCLLKAGASIHITDGDEQTPLHACAFFPNEQNLWSVLSNRNLRHRDHTGSTIPNDRFRPDAMKGYEQRLRYSCNYSGPRSSEHGTCRVGGIVDMLLEAGADPLALDDSKRFPLDLAIANDCKEMVSKLAFTSEKITESWDIEKKNREKLPTLLAISTVSGTPSMQQLDEETRKEVLKKPERWIGILDYPSLCSWVGTHKDELANDPAATNKLLLEAARDGLTELMTALDSLATLNDDPSTILERYKKETEGKRCPPALDGYAPVLLSACHRTSYNLQMVQLLVEKCGVNVNAHALAAPDRYSMKKGDPGHVPGATALHVLATGKSFWQVLAIRYLVSKGADINALNEKGETPLHVASKGDVKTNVGVSEGFWTPDCAAVLLELGADPNILDSKGLSCLHKASSLPGIMRSLLAKGADLNLGKLSPLFTSIQSQNLKALEILLDAGADPNSIDQNNGFQVHYLVKGQTRTALFCASFSNLFNQQAVNNAPLVKHLIQRGADPYARLTETETLIHYVFEHGEQEIIFAFLECAELIDWEKRDQLGRTVLLAAANWTGTLQGYRHQHWVDKIKAPIIRLLDLSVDPLVTDDSGRHVMHHLCANEDMEEDAILQFLEFPAAKDLLLKKDKKGYSSLHEALKVLRPRTIEKLLSMGANLQSPDPENKTALHHVAKQCLEITERQRASHLRREHPPEWHTGLYILWKKFLADGGDIDCKDKGGNTPLFIFLSTSQGSKGAHHLETLDKFFDHKAKCGEGEDQDEELEWKADIFVRNNEGETALHVVARSGLALPEIEKDLFAELVKRGLDPLAEDAQGRSALDVAAACGKGPILEMFERGGRKESGVKKDGAVGVNNWC
ncbi:uncharacterized protein PAC_05058 [Phialocephala subalpina]|uniref:NACHT domain-containing protein n=1 Tax=Phialocephala subalpina TaxID=576137 RepID=A0A1L7WQY8_9HELO|nr:uncharacterized protein PAC_05058 [Phialocephala subalpina]